MLQQKLVLLSMAAIMCAGLWANARAQLGEFSILCARRGTSEGIYLDNTSAASMTKLYPAVNQNEEMVASMPLPDGRQVAAHLSGNRLLTCSNDGSNARRTQPCIRPLP
jgi:hypothetical protein